MHLVQLMLIKTKLGRMILVRIRNKLLFVGGGNFTVIFDSLLKTVYLTKDACAFDVTWLCTVLLTLHDVAVCCVLEMSDVIDSCVTDIAELIACHATNI